MNHSFKNDLTLNNMFFVYVQGAMFLLAIILLASAYIIDYSSASLPVVFSVLIYLIAILSFFDREKYFSISFLFILACGVFLLGRQFAYILSMGDISVYVVGFLSQEVLTPQTYAKYCFLILSCIVSFGFGAALSKIKFGIDSQPSKFNKGKVKSPWILFFCFSILAITAFTYFELVQYVLTYGYKGIYVYNAEAAQSPSLMSKLSFYSYPLTLVLFSYTLVYRKIKKEILLLLFIIILKALLMASLGQRGPFMCTLLFIMCMITKNKKVGLFKACVFLFSLIVMAQLINYFRGSGVAIDSIYNALVRFLYEQGITFYIPYLSNMYDFPTLAKVQTIIPGSKFIYSLFSGNTPELQEYVLGHFLTYQVDSVAFSSGAGLGWSIISDFQQIIGGMDLLIILSMLAFGFVLSFLESARSSDNMKFIVYAAAIPIIFLPRSSLANVIPIVILCIFIIILRCSKRKIFIGKGV